MIVFVVLAAVVFWYPFKALGARVPRLRGPVARLRRWTAGAHAWVLSAPLTFCYIAVFTCFTLVQTTAPPRLIDIMTAVDSTNLHQLRRHTVTVFATSAFWVADHGSGLSLYVIGFASAVAWAERRYGTPRLAVILCCGHVFGSLITQALLSRAIRAGRAPARLTHTTDVGVSYLLVAGLAAAVLALRGPARVIAAAVLASGLALPMLTSRTLWDLGHVIAASCGLLAAAVCRLAGELRVVPAAFTRPGKPGS